MFEKILYNVTKEHPRVHNITNYVSAADQANMTLTVGGSPIMAGDPLEAEEVCSICDGLVLNTGILSQSSLDAMLLAGKTAMKKGIPIILDPVGAGVSAFRTSGIKQILKNIKLSAIHLNASELKALCTDTVNTGGVDVTGEFSIENTINYAKMLAENTQTVILVTGADDIVTDGKKTALIHNGCKMLSRITASGCMLSSVMGVYAAANPENIFEAVLCAAAHSSLSAERAWHEGIGTGSYKINFFDEMTYPQFGGADIEYK